MEPFDLYRVRGSERGWVHKHGMALVELFRLADVAVIGLGLWAALWRVGAAWQWEVLLIALTTALIFDLVARRLTVYRSWRTASLKEELWRVAGSWILTVFVLAGLLYLLSPDLHRHRDLLPTWAVVGLAGLLGTRVMVRLTLRRLRSRGANFRIAAILGATAAGMQVADTLRRNAWIGVKVIGIYDDRAPSDERTHPGMAVAGGWAELRESIAQGHLDIVYVALPLRAEVRIGQLVEELRDMAVSVQFVADFSALGLLNPRWEILGGMPTVTLVETPHQGVDGLLKRGLDIVGSSIALVLLALPMALIAGAIKLDSPGPVIFRQRRYGLDGHPFEIYKFRTMKVAETGQDSFVQATRGDARITRLGALLRRTSADELPQFINVLQGRMSIVGPRPHPMALDESQRQLIDGYRLRHKVLPGITGWAQVNGFRGETDTPDKMISRIRFDLEYIEGWSIWLDLRIIWMTAFKVLHDPKAF